MAFFDRVFSNSCPRIYSIMNEDHAALYKIIASLRDAAGKRCKTEADRAEQRTLGLDLMEKLVAESIAHFEREEGLMARYEYPLGRQHAMEHLVLLRALETVQLEVRNSSEGVTRETVDYLKNWLTRHIGGADKHLETFLSGCSDRRIKKRKDLSDVGSHPLSFLLTVSDATPAEVVAANRSFRAQYEAGVEERLQAHDDEERFRTSDIERKRLQDRIWYE